MKVVDGYNVYTKTKLKSILKKHNDWVMKTKNKEGNYVGERANLEYANLKYARLEGANLYGANLYGANLECANLEGANLEGANLKYANLKDAYLEGANNIPYIRLACPDTGSFVAWKKLRDSKIAKLLIPEDAKRSSSTTSKCRASKAVVLSIETKDGNLCQNGNSLYDSNFRYTVGETLEVEDFDDNRWNECSKGIHFFINKQEAIDYY